LGCCIIVLGWALNREEHLRASKGLILDAW
jgi:hypothetical protein